MSLVTSCGTLAGFRRVEQGAHPGTWCSMCMTLSLIVPPRCSTPMAREPDQVIVVNMEVMSGTDFCALRILGQTQWVIGSDVKIIFIGLLIVVDNSWKYWSIWCSLFWVGIINNCLFIIIIKLSFIVIKKYLNVYKNYVMIGKSRYNWNVYISKQRMV